MTSIQERLQLKREPFDKWSVREQLCLASAVARSGDQNWMSVSRALKPFGEPNRPTDWFHQKNCAAQYGALLSNVETPKRKKRVSGVEAVVETPSECILKRLLFERQAELQKLLAEEKAEYQKLQEDMKLLQSGKVSEEELDKWCKEIDEEEFKREQEAQTHAQWLKQRDLRKQEIERAWRPIKSSVHIVGQKRKLSDALEDFGDQDSEDQIQQQLMSDSQVHQQLVQQEPQQSQHQFIQVQTPEPGKPALSPLLTSLLKSPSQVQNMSSVSTSILHTAITNQDTSKGVLHGGSANPTIASLLNSSTGMGASSNLQHFVSNAITQGSNASPDVESVHDQTQRLDAILDDANIKLDDLANSILVQDGPLPEIKKEEVDDIISEIIENAHDIVADPEQHLQLDGNGDININLELDDLEEEVIHEEEPSKEEQNEQQPIKTPEKPNPPAPVVDPFEFQEDPILFDTPVKPSTMKQDNAHSYVPSYQQQQSPVKTSSDIVKSSVEKPSECTQIPEISPEVKTNQPNNVHGSVEIIEVRGEEQEKEKEFNKSQIEDIVHCSKDETVVKEEKECDVGTKEENEETVVEETNEVETEAVETKPSHDFLEEEKASVNPPEVSGPESSSQTSITSDLAEDLYDNINMEVKIDKTGKTKRDYSRTKKKEDKCFDMLLTIEKSSLDDLDVGDDVISDNRMESDKREPKIRLKSDNERSNSPWTEEEDIASLRGNKRRLSTPGTPIDSLPNSPASTSAFYDDDKDYRNWKKSVMLVYNRLASNKYASLFLKPITEDQAPGYRSVVYRPMDLLTIKKHIDSGIIRTSLEFKRDVMLMFTNAIMYNKTNDTIFNMALQMQQESMNPIEILLQAQADAPIRRETRTSESSCKRKRGVDDPAKLKKRKED